MPTTIVTSKNFDKKFKKLARKLQLQAKSRIIIFLENPLNPILNNHLLNGDKKLIRSINVSGDFRILYREVGTDIIHLIDVDTHSNLY